jgi:hypothetical protein
VIRRQTIWGHQIRWTAAGNISVNPNDPEDVTVVWADRGTPNPFVAGTANDDCVEEAPEPPNYDPCNAGPGSDTSVYSATSTDGGETWGPRTLVDAAGGRHQWFVWSDHLSDGSLAIAWDEDDQLPVDADPGPGLVPANDTFHHVLLSSGAKETLGAPENIDVSLTHWAGQYVPRELWPRACGPFGYEDTGGPPTDEGKDCNEFHGDYTGLAVGSNGTINVVWTGLNRFTTSDQLDFYTGDFHDGYAQDAMFARR